MQPIGTEQNTNVYWKKQTNKQKRKVEVTIIQGHRILELEGALAHKKEKKDLY